MKLKKLKILFRKFLKFDDQRFYKAKDLYRKIKVFRDPTVLTYLYFEQIINFIKRPNSKIYID